MSMSSSFIRFRIGKCSNPQLVAARTNEPQKVVAGNVGRRGILQRVAIDLVVMHQLAIKYDAYAMLAIVNECERGHRSRWHAERRHQQLGLAE